MSREIKFRAWVNNHWVDWLPNSKTLGEYNEVGIYADEYDTEEKCFIEQYTGIKDNIGKEIYEGDIVKVYSKRKLLDGFYQVIWNEETGGFECECLKPMVEGQDNIKDVRVFNEYYSKFRVFGNIHENPELLGGEE